MPGAGGEGEGGAVSRNGTAENVADGDTDSREEDEAKDHPFTEETSKIRPQRHQERDKCGNEEEGGRPRQGRAARCAGPGANRAMATPAASGPKIDNPTPCSDPFGPNVKFEREDVFQQFHA